VQTVRRKGRLSVVRDFWAVVDDVEPDEAFVVTTVGFTRDAIRFAKAKGIKLAVLRHATEADLEGRVTAITIDITMIGLQVTDLTWQVDASDRVGDAAAETRAPRDVGLGCEGY